MRDTINDRAINNMISEMLDYDDPYMLEYAEEAWLNRMENDNADL